MFSNPHVCFLVHNFYIHKIKLVTSGLRVLVYIGVSFLLQHIFLVLSNSVFKLSTSFSHIDGVTLNAINPVDNT